jgi:hypothetical protein
MNEDQIIDMGQDQSGLVVDQAARTGLKDASTWGMVISIFGFIMVGFILLGGVIMIGMSAFMSQADSPFPVWVLTLVYFGIAALYFFPILYLYRFSNKLKRALTYNDAQSLTDSCVNLGKHYKFMGILLICLLALYLIMMLAGLSMAKYMGL